MKQSKERRDQKPPFANAHEPLSSLPVEKGQGQWLEPLLKMVEESPHAASPDWLIRLTRLQKCLNPSPHNQEEKNPARLWPAEFALLLQSLVGHAGHLVLTFLREEKQESALQPEQQSLELLEQSASSLQEEVGSLQKQLFAKSDKNDKGDHEFWKAWSHLLQKGEALLGDLQKDSHLPNPVLDRQLESMHGLFVAHLTWLKEQTQLTTSEGEQSSWGRWMGNLLGVGSKQEPKAASDGKGEANQSGNQKSFLKLEPVGPQLQELQKAFTRLLQEIAKEAKVLERKQRRDSRKTPGTRSDLKQLINSQEHALLELRESLLDSFPTSGGVAAPEGISKAFQAIRQLLQDPEALEKLDENKHRSKAGVRAEKLAASGEQDFDSDAQQSSARGIGVPLGQNGSQSSPSSELLPAPSVTHAKGEQNPGSEREALLNPPDLVDSDASINQQEAVPEYPPELLDKALKWIRKGRRGREFRDMIHVLQVPLALHRSFFQSLQEHPQIICLSLPEQETRFLWQEELKPLFPSSPESA